MPRTGRFIRPSVMAATGSACGNCRSLSLAAAFLFVWCPRPESNRHDQRSRDFLATSAFAASMDAVRGLEHAFILASRRALRLRCPPSALYTFPGVSHPGAWLGVGSDA